MYHAIVRNLTRRSFEAVNGHDYETLLKGCSPDLHHRFGGHHAAGGERHGIEAMRRWLHRLGRLMPNLKLDVHDVWVKGLPSSTSIFVRWDATATLADGSPYANRGVHVIHMRWGKVQSIDAHEDSQAVAEGLQRQLAAGIEEAGASPLH